MVVRMLVQNFLKLTDMSVNVRIHENEKGNYYFQDNKNVEEINYTD